MSPILNISNSILAEIFAQLLTYSIMELMLDLIVKGWYFLVTLLSS